MDFNTSGIRSPFSPRVKQTLTGRRPGLSSAKKNSNQFMQSFNEPSGEVIYKTPHHTIETYGLPLPVMVTEALAFASGELSVRMSSCGWCWLVCGRRVLAWPYDPELGSSGASAARELTLPQTDLAHKADLVVLFYEEDAQMPSCIGVSPEGVVRCWPSLGQEGVYCDTPLELGGQEVEQLEPPARPGAPLLLATTTCTLVLLTHLIVDGRSSVSSRTLRPPSGWLGGIGRRVSLLFFGSMPAHADTKLVGVVTVRDGPLLDPDSEECGCVALVGAAGAGAGAGAASPGGAGAAGGAVLQLWHRELHEHRLQRLLPPVGEVCGEVSALALVAAPPLHLLLLLAARDTRWALAHVNISDPAAPRVTSLAPLRSWRPSEAPPPRLLPLPPSAQPPALLYTHRYIATINFGGGGAGGAGAEWALLEGGAGERLLGGAVCGGRPLLFSQAHGVLAVRPGAAQAQQSMGAGAGMEAGAGAGAGLGDVYSGNLSLLEIDPHEISSISTDACGKLKTAFLFHLRRDTAACAALLAELGGAGGAGGAGAGGAADVDAPLDRTVYRLAEEMLDDVPAGDPRWKVPLSSVGGPPLGSSGALQLGGQLRDKQRAFSLLGAFLRGAPLRLGRLSNEGGSGSVSTWAALGSLGGRLAGALALHDCRQPVLEEVFRKVVEAHIDEEEPCVAEGLSRGTLAPRDVALRRVSQLPRLLLQLCAAPAASHPADILLSVFREMHKYRAAWAGAGAGGAGAGEAVTSPLPLLSAATDLINRMASACKEPSTEPAARDSLLAALAALGAAVLREAAPLRGRGAARLRRAALQPLVDSGQLERAAALAEQHGQLEVLLELCVRRRDLRQLQLYLHQYENEGFPELAYSRLWQLGGWWRAALVRLGGAARLGGWLRAQGGGGGGGAGGGGGGGLAATHAAAGGDLGAAAELCALEANKETSSVERLVTVASFGKLCALASAAPAPAPLASLERSLRLGAQAGALPPRLRGRHGLRGEGRVPPPEEMVEMYCEWSDGGLTECDYQRALELTADVADDELRQALRLKVWCACALADSWAPGGAQEPRDQLLDKVFFRLVDLVHLMGGDISALLPPAAALLAAPQLAPLAADPHFQFLLKYGYECLREAAPMEP